MRSHSRVHHPLFGMGWSPSQLVLTILVALLFLIFLFIFLMITAEPAQGQTSVPPTAVQAAKLPQFASKLSHAVKLSPQETASRLHQAQPRASYKKGRNILPLDSNNVYDNGPINGTTDAWLINFGYFVADSFNLSTNTSLNGMTFGAWLEPGDTLQTVEISITSAPFGGTSYFDQVVTVTQSGCVSNQYGFNVCTVSASWSDVPFNSGAYWVNLQNAIDNEGNPVYWDENSGVGCTGSGCPSSADENSIGTLPSESFTILGEATTTSNNTIYSCPPPQPGFADVHDLNVPSSSVVVDPAGNLHGAGSRGTYGQGLLYALARKAGYWLLNSLYSFVGGSDGNTPGNVITGPGGALYGFAQGGIQSCGGDGSSYCGLIYKANPSNTCGKAVCSWNETSIYEFTGNTDAWGGSPLVFDSAGNLYGISASGGIYGQGAVFQLTPTQTGWTETILYSFLGGNDGGTPNSLLLGRDGNLYGTAQFGGASIWGVVFKLTRSQGTWPETVLYSFTGGTDGFFPGGLIQDSSGNLIGFSTCYNSEYGNYCGSGYYQDWYGLIFSLRLGPHGYGFNLLYNNVEDCQWNRNDFHALAVDSTGTIYGVEGGDDFGCGPGGCYSINCGQIMSVNSGPLISGQADIFTNLTLDTNGHLYGTTQTCGGLGTPFRSNGMVWEYSQQNK